LKRQASDLKRRRESAPTKTRRRRKRSNSYSLLTGVAWGTQFAVDFLAMPVQKFKPRMYSPTFEKLNQELLKQCQETTASAKQAIAVSKKLTEEDPQNFLRQSKVPVQPRYSRAESVGL
jgi:hypothetical protein